MDWQDQALAFGIHEHKRNVICVSAIASGSSNGMRGTSGARSAIAMPNVALSHTAI